ncbi:MAG: nucleotidyltransferase family protein [Hyphomicrobium sp.]
MLNIGDIEAFLAETQVITTLLKPVAELGIDDCWIGAGLVRNAVWDKLHGYPIQPLVGSDVDVIYCNYTDTTRERDVGIERRLSCVLPAIPWSVRNQARMYERNGDPPYENCEDAIRYWPETATAIAARLHEGQVQVIAPLGVGDLVNMLVRPSPAFARKIDVYERRLAAKDWAKRWPRLKFVGP